MTVLPGSPAGSPRRGTGRRAVAVSGVLCLSLAGAACSVSTVAPRAAPAAHSSPAAPPRPATTAPLALQITPAPYQLPSGISREVVLPDGRDLLIAGGIGQWPAATRAVTLLDPVTGRTARAGTLADPAHDAAGAVLHGRPYLFGGGVRASLAQVQALTHGTATVAGHLPGPRSGLAAVTLSGTVYLLGGYDGSSYDAQVLATTDGRSFRVVARLAVPVRDGAVAGIGRRIWVFGGETPAGPVRAIQRVDLVTGKTAVVGHLPAPLMGAAAFTLGGRVYVAGGQVSPAAGVPGSAGNASGMVTTGEVLGFNPADHQVRVAGRLPVPVANAAAAVTGGTAFLIGGSDGRRQVPTVTTLRLVSVAGALPTTVLGGQAADPLNASADGPAGTPSPRPAAAGGTTGGELLANAPWLAPAHGRGHLAHGSSPSALPGDILIADALNNRILIVDPQGRIRWQFPRKGDLRPGQKFLTPDDAFFSPNGKYIIATEENYSVVSVIDIATHRIVYRYGTPGVPGATANHVSNPDDAMMMPDGKIISADIRNCRLLLLSPPSHRPARIYGHTGVCAHNPPAAFGSPNGAFPATNGHFIVTEINGDWASEMSLAGHVSWSVHPPGVLYPSDTNEVYPGRYLTADYSPAGQVVEFSSHGRLLWRFGGLNHPSLALPLPNGNILVNDDYNDRVIVIDPLTNKIVWQYGHKGVPGRAPGYLSDPDGLDLAPPNSMLITHSSTMGQPGSRKP